MSRSACISSSEYPPLASLRRDLVASFSGQSERFASMTLVRSMGY